MAGTASAAIVADTTTPQILSGKVLIESFMAILLASIGPGFTACILPPT